MERVAFLVEKTGQRISCLLNPETLLMRRVSGVRPRHSVRGLMTGAAATDDQLLFTGGGTTELQLDLLFDVTLLTPPAQQQEAPVEPLEDVRELTRPLWGLAENVQGDDGFATTPLVRFIWGKSWNVLGIVAALSDRLEYFTIGGAPRRSWLRMRFLRVAEPEQAVDTDIPEPPDIELPAPGEEIPPEELQMYEIAGGAEGADIEARGISPQGQQGLIEQLYILAHRYYGNASLWKFLAEYNGIDDPFHIPAGVRLQIPPIAGTRRNV